MTTYEEFCLQTQQEMPEIVKVFKNRDLPGVTYVRLDAPKEVVFSLLMEAWVDGEREEGWNECLRYLEQIKILCSVRIDRQGPSLFLPEGPRQP